MGYSTSSSDDEEEESKDNERRKRSSKKKSKKSKKKHKKKRKRHKRMSTSELSSSGSEDAQWVVKGDSDVGTKLGGIGQALAGASNNRNASAKPPEEDNNDWSNFNSFIPTYSNTAKKGQRQTKKEWDVVRSATKPGQHARELNPYWKDGGDGLPSQEPGVSLPESSEPVAELPSSVTDGGLYWLRKSYQRAKEQAREEGRSLEEVAVERWGSLSNFHTMLEEAEKKCGKHSTDSKSKYEGNNREQWKSRSSFQRPKRDSSGGSDDNMSSERRPKSNRDQRSECPSSSLSYQRQPAWMKQSSSTSRRVKGVDDIPSPPISSPKVEKRAAVDVEPEDTGMEQEKVATVILTDQEMNALSAKILKAEMLGNTVSASELKSKHAEAEANRQKFIKDGGNPQKQSEDSSRKVITKIVMGSENRGRKRDKPSETHQDGQRVRYFPDDDKQSLANMFQREKTSTVEDENALFSRLAGKGMKSKPTDDYDLDDIFADKASSSKKAEKEKEADVHKVINEQKFYKKMVDDCPWCFDGHKLEKNIVASMGEKSFLCVPPFQSLSEGHCLIVPMFHVSAATDLDEDVWDEMQKFRHALVRMFKEQDEDLVIFETAMSLQRHPHMYLECVPIPKETGELAPIYFKKAIQECETEWSQNKKLVDLRGRDVRKSIPKGLPYFSVDFGDDSGFAHVIEDERNFPRNFAQEIIGGMMELDHSIWRKRKNDNFKEQREKVMKFLKVWGPHDWTRDG